jgi:glycosyltransferase involved in cell wall biosynthesis
MNIYIDGSKRHAVSRMFPVWESLGHEVTNNPKKADVQLSVVRITNKTGLPTVLRLDGIYYDAATDYKHRNKSISKAHMEADGLVYQSDTSRQMCERYLGRRKGEYKVIHNGINPTGWNNPSAHTGINMFCCGKWRRPKRLEETIKVFQRFRKEFPLARLFVVGGFKKGAKEIKAENVIYSGQIDHDDMKKLYTLGDVFVQLCKKDSCPSTVVESIASGMPVVTTNACGGAAEMSRLTPGCVAVAGEEDTLDPDYIYQDECHKIPDAVMNNMVKAMVDIVENKTRVDLPKKLTIDYAAKQYLDLMEAVC